MKTLHIAPGDSAGGSILLAMQELGRDDEVLRFLDDLSCGPIEPDLPAIRAMWWGPYYEEREIEGKLKAFWDCVLTTDERLVVWVSRRSAQEYAFFLAWVDRLGKRPYSVIDVTGRMLPGLTRPLSSVGYMPPYQLKAVLGSERALTDREKTDARELWSRLKKENAPFRIVTPDGMASAPIDHFDPLLIEQATTEWRKVARLIGDTIGLNLDPYDQIDVLMLWTRIAALIDQGKLLADGDPSDMHVTRVRLSD